MCERQGISPEDADLEAVRGFLDVILPALEELDAPHSRRDVRPAS